MIYIEDYETVNSNHPTSIISTVPESKHGNRVISIYTEYYKRERLNNTHSTGIVNYKTCAGTLDPNLLLL